jgi:hypothetical protein
MEIDEDTRICSFDIKNMYTNIPKSDILNIIKYNEQKSKHHKPKRTIRNIKNNNGTKLFSIQPTVL